jgi:hypothetical protein
MDYGYYYTSYLQNFWLRAVPVYSPSPCQPGNAKVNYRPDVNYSRKDGLDNDACYFKVVQWKEGANASDNGIFVNLI